jgi:hypothetical protein
MGLQHQFINISTSLNLQQQHPNSSTIHPIYDTHSNNSTTTYVMITTTTFEHKFINNSTTTTSSIINYAQKQLMFISTHFNIQILQQHHN